MADHMPIMASGSLSSARDKNVVRRPPKQRFLRQSNQPKSSVIRINQPYNNVRRFARRSMFKDEGEAVAIPYGTESHSELSHGHKCSDITSDHTMRRHIFISPEVPVPNNTEAPRPGYRPEDPKTCARAMSSLLYLQQLPAAVPKPRQRSTLHVEKKNSGSVLEGKQPYYGRRRTDLVGSNWGDCGLRNEDSSIQFALGSAR